MWNWAWACCSRLSCSAWAVLMKIPSSGLNCRMLPCKWVMKWPKLRMQQIRTTDCKEAEGPSPAWSPRSPSQPRPHGARVWMGQRPPFTKPKGNVLDGNTRLKTELQESLRLARKLRHPGSLGSLCSRKPQKTSRCSPRHLCSSPWCREKESQEELRLARPCSGRHTASSRGAQDGCALLQPPRQLETASRAQPADRKLTNTVPRQAPEQGPRFEAGVSALPAPKGTDWSSKARQEEKNCLFLLPLPRKDGLSPWCLGKQTDVLGEGSERQ